MDFCPFTLAELRELESRLVQEIKRREQHELTRARLQIIEIARNIGLPLRDILGMPSRGNRTGPPLGSKVGAKFRHPHQPDLTWSGRGRQPIWLREALAEGISWQELSIVQIPV